MNTLTFVGVSLLAIQATRSARYTAIASKLAPTQVPCVIYFTSGGVVKV